MSMVEGDKPELALVYSPQYFIRKGHPRDRKNYSLFARVFNDLFGPNSLVDIGCGLGWFISWFLENRPDMPCLGLEGAEGAFEVMASDVRTRCIRRDLRDPVDVALTDYDWSVSIEVAEHIEEDYVLRYLGWITQTPNLLLTAAPPRQTGKGHVNLQPPAYWVDKLRYFGYRQDHYDLLNRWKCLCSEQTVGTQHVIRNAMTFSRR
jgi:hypothetical protein